MPNCEMCSAYDCLRCNARFYKIGTVNGIRCVRKCPRGHMVVNGMCKMRFRGGLFIHLASYLFIDLVS